ncbi:GNAT family N-acetyltransferase [Streptomyces fuscigenes]|uniref:GNAT family N-acetyltransferase n=1 Tax=Streptomyces fuscigenes TaxID=1528880 RepID=UPI001F1CFFB9|nr:GNAT family N-acetyltransferase [Streptomyces fuscigenes]MCF3964588.1 GNAT family N-acetyltransferase [Streptomyces fuscigenes]
MDPIPDMPDAPSPRAAAVREAAPADAEELVRLRAVMLDSLNPGHGDDSWMPASVAILRAALAVPGATMNAFVVDDPERPGALAACVVGTVEQRLGAPGNEAGLSGHVFSVATDPSMRRRGYSRACMEALLRWYRERGVTKIDLHASAEGAPLYASLGFAPTRAPAMRLRL